MVSESSDEVVVRSSNCDSDSESDEVESEESRLDLAATERECLSSRRLLSSSSSSSSSSTSSTLIAPFSGDEDAPADSAIGDGEAREDGVGGISGVFGKREERGVWPLGRG